MALHEEPDKSGLLTTIDILSPDQWNQQVDQLWSDFPGGDDGILPTHFLKSTYPKINGQIVRYAEADSRFWAVLLPKGDHDWTLRAHWLKAGEEFKARVQT